MELFGERLGKLVDLPPNERRHRHYSGTFPFRFLQAMRAIGTSPNENYVSLCVLNCRYPGLRNKFQHLHCNKICYPVSRCTVLCY